MVSLVTGLIRIKYNKCSMFGIRDEISSGIGRTMKPERSDGSDLRWKRSETKADEPRGQKVLAGGKQAERRLTRRQSVRRLDVLKGAIVLILVGLTIGL